MSIPHSITSGASGVDTVLAFNPNDNRPVYSADSSHPHWNAIVEGLKAGDESVFELFDVAGGLMKRLRSLSDRIDYDGENILFDGEVVDTALADQIKRFLEQGVDDYKPLVKFWEKVAANPNAHSREQLFRWLQSHDFTVTEDGDIVGYKGVNTLVEGKEWCSTHAGTATVDGKVINGYIPNKVGSVITMPRKDVKHDPSATCHTGLHVGDFSYASHYGDTVLEVHVNPRDVVSIPTDAGGRKMRCCRYKVIQPIGKHYDTAVRPSGNLGSEEPTWAGDVGYKPF